MKELLPAKTQRRKEISNVKAPLNNFSFLRRSSKSNKRGHPAWDGFSWDGL